MVAGNSRPLLPHGRYRELHREQSVRMDAQAGAGGRFFAPLGSLDPQGSGDLREQNGLMRKNDSGMPLRKLGRIGREVSIVGFGGAHPCFPHVPEATTIRMV